MVIRGAMNKKLADDLKYCASVNKALTDHYYNYPDTPEGFVEWQKILMNHLENAFLRYKNNSPTVVSSTGIRGSKRWYNDATLRERYIEKYGILSDFCIFVNNQYAFLALC